MTSPNQSTPDGSLGVGAFAEWQAMTEEDAKAKMKVPLSAWNGAQGSFQSEFISAPLFGGEVARLDNRIDELLIGTERAIRYTYSESDVWPKHPAAYKVEVDIFSGASGGRNGASATLGGQGGYAGGWDRFVFTGSALADLPPNVAVTIGSGTPGGSTQDAGESTFGTFGVVAGATPTNYGSGARTYKMRGGAGGNETKNGEGGSSGPFHPGGSGGLRTGGNGGNGGNGFSVELGQVGPGSAGGGGAGGTSVFGAGGRGGHGGWPAGPGGAGGAGYGGVGAGGVGAGGMVVVTVYVEDTFGVPPSAPTGVTVSGVTSTAAHVSWVASIDDVMVKNYIIYLNGSRYAVVTTSFHDFVGLTPSTAYSVRVQAVDIGDNASEMSDPLSFTTLAT